jgi:ABC-2 type transport system ATP-binding protein
MIIVNLQDIYFSYRIMASNQASLKFFFKDLVRGKVRLENHEVLNGISLKITTGETLGIIGKNGAGKSTLLKILAGVIPPSSGKVVIPHNVAPMIDLGAGFNPELTARENILFYSSLLGRDLRVVKTRINEIGTWAGLTNDLDHQLRTFSSGMVARLAFATATDAVPELLLVDEVLSVGDSEFALKSKRRMTEIISSGTTVAIVSHDLKTIAEITTRVIWLDGGRIVADGEPKDVIAEYMMRFGK